MKKAKTVYIIAAIISLIIYFAGIMTGINIYNSITKTVDEDLSSIKSDIENQQQELILLSIRGKESCSILNAISSTTAENLESVSYEIRKLEQTGQKDSKFNKMKELYSTLSVRAWILKSSINDNCDSKSISILYYYSYPCNDCKKQEEVFDAVKFKDPQKILIYAVDKDVNSTIVQTLVKGHYIKNSPSFVISNETYSSFVDSANLTILINKYLNLTS